MKVSRSEFMRLLTTAMDEGEFVAMRGMLHLYSVEGEYWVFNRAECMVSVHSKTLINI